MYARIATFEGMPTDRIDEMIERNRREIEEGFDSPPEGLEGIKGVWMLVDRKSGKGMGISLFENEADLERGDAALNAMSPGDGGTRRAGVEVYEVAVRRDRG